MRVSRQEYWSGWSFPSPRDIPDPGIEPASPSLQVNSLSLSHQGSLICLRVEGAGEVQGFTVHYLRQLTERGLSNTAYRQDSSWVLVPGRLAGEGYPCRISWDSRGCPVWKAQEKYQGSASWKTASPRGSEQRQSREGEGSAVGSAVNSAIWEEKG